MGKKKQKIPKTIPRKLSSDGQYIVSLTSKTPTIAEEQQPKKLKKRSKGKSSLKKPKTTMFSLEFDI